MEALTGNLLRQMEEMPAFSVDAHVKLRLLACADADDVLREHGAELPELMALLAKEYGCRHHELLFSLVRARPLYRNGYLLLMLTAEDGAVPPLAQSLRPIFAPDDLCWAARNVFLRWQDAGSAQTHRNMLLFCGAHMSARWLADYEDHLNELAARGEMDLALHAVHALSLSGELLVRQALDRMGREHARDEIRAAAARAGEGMVV